MMYQKRIPVKNDIRIVCTYLKNLGRLEELSQGFNLPFKKLVVFSIGENQLTPSEYRRAENATKQLAANSEEIRDEINSKN